MRLPHSWSLLFLALSSLQSALTAVLPGRRSSKSFNSAGGARDLFLRRVLDRSPAYGNFTQYSATNRTLKVGIVGGGIAGLYSALLLESVGIDYEILEASKRIGGRIYTHRFDEKKWNASKPGETDYYNYYDAGAMRFPGMPYMDRVIGEQNNSIVSYVNSRNKTAADGINLIPYIFQGPNTFNLYNSKLQFTNLTTSAEAFNVTRAQGGPVRNDVFSVQSPADVLSMAVNDLTDALDNDFDTGFEKLMKFDKFSVREYLTEKKFEAAEVDWIETVDDATLHYDSESLSQAVLDQWTFDSALPSSWKCVEGGMDRITAGISKILKNPILLSKRVTAVRPGLEGELVVVINHKETRRYAHVINTVPLGVMQTMDLSELKLDYNKTLAIRRSCRKDWWENLPAPIRGGQSFSDLPIRRCVYPSYGINTTEGPAAMIASYTWGQDSNRLGAFYNTPEARAQVIATTLRDLARMNNVTEAFLKDQFLDAHLWDWYGDEFAVGGFALFAPGQYTRIMPALMQPAYNGKLHFAGEALSSGHGWIIGALSSAYRTVAEVLAVEKREDLLKELVYRWGITTEIDMGWYNS